jgi:glycosyltransferase involved in cell wall biosynthesis
LARKLGLVARLPGWLDDVRTVLAASDVIALASDGEGLPTAILEALAAGRPVVATDAGGTSAALGRHGRLVAPDDAAGLAQALQTALSGELAFDPQAARAHVCRGFDIRSTAARVSDIHATALGNGT